MKAKNYILIIGILLLVSFLIFFFKKSGDRSLPRISTNETNVYRYTIKNHESDLKSSNIILDTLVDSSENRKETASLQTAENSTKNLISKTKSSSTNAKSTRKIKTARRVSVDRDYAVNMKDNVVVFELKSGDIVTNGSRSEIKLPAVYNKHYEFEFKPVQYQYEGQWFSLADWHQVPAISRLRNAEGKSSVPPLSLRLIEDKIYFYNVANAEKNDISVRALGVPLKPEWNKFSLDIDWSDNNKGTLIVTINGKSKRFDNITNTYDESSPIFFKFGIYRGKQYKSTSKVEFRNIIVDGYAIQPDFLTSPAGKTN